MADRPSNWLKVFQTFADDARISSKEATAFDERGTKLEMWESQRRFLHEVGSGLDRGIRKFYCLKSRQLGITTISLLIDTFWLAMHEGLTGALVTDTPKNSGVNRKIIESYVASFPEGYFGDKFSVVKSNRDFIQFSNGSRLDLLVAGIKKKSSTSWGEGVGYAFAHCTEVAAYGDPDGLASFEESFAQKNPNRLFIYESTAKGFNLWRDRYMEGLDDLTSHSFFVGWWGGDTNVIERSDPRYAVYGTYPTTSEEREKIAAVASLYKWKITPEQLAWIRWKNSNPSADTDLLSQNQPWTAEDAFVQSGYSFFQTRMIGKDMEKIADGGDAYGFSAYRYDLSNSFFDIKLQAIEDPDQFDLIELKVWEEPHPNGRYVIGFDPAWGRSEHKDRHAIGVFRCFADKIVQVAEYATADVEPKHAAWVLAHLAGAYKNCIVNIELNGPGRVIMPEWDHVIALMKAEQYAAKTRDLNWEDALDQARWYLWHKPDTMGAGYAYNTDSSSRQKTELMFTMRGAYVTRELVIRSMALLKEMQLVVQDGVEIGAPESRSADCKDDRVFASAYAIKAWIDWVRPSMLTENLTYERVMLEESGEMPAVARSLNTLVSDFFKTREEINNREPERGPKWMLDRGLV